MAPITASWSMPLSMVHGVGPHLPDGNGLLDPSSDQGILCHGKLDTLTLPQLIGAPPACIGLLQAAAV